MSKTLFFYLFKDLVRIFLMTSGALAGIMSFAGMLRPITENGLDLGQVSKILTYLSPGMTTYSLPVAALFAATVVYGRFSSDNELTAMRAGGISYLSARRFSIALPALVLGLLVALGSLAMLCFIVPIYSLKVEEVIYSNIAKVIASKIEKNHEVDFRNGADEHDIFAQSAELLDPDPKHPEVQQVKLIGPAIMTFDYSNPSLPPKDFYMASSALVTITRAGGVGSEGAGNLVVRLKDGRKFPREFAGNMQAGIEETVFGPIEIPSMINENVKFMTEGHLLQLWADPTQSKKVQTVLRGIIRREEEEGFLQSLAKEIAENGSCTLGTRGQEIADNYKIWGSGITSVLDHGALVVTCIDSGDGRNVKFNHSRGMQTNLDARSKEVRIHCRADSIEKQLAITIELWDTELQTGEVISPRMSYPQTFNVPMPPDILAIENRPLNQYENDPLLTGGEPLFLHHEKLFVNNAVLSELHSRAAFALSCLVLVMVGCALGTMFRSGNFLTAFAVSFIPALLVITLIVCGQQIATHIPYDMVHDPLHTGLWFIWIGNFAVLGTAVYLTGKLQRR